MIISNVGKSLEWGDVIIYEEIILGELLRDDDLETIRKTGDDYKFEDFVKKESGDLLLGQGFSATDYELRYCCDTDDLFFGATDRFAIIAFRNKDEKLCVNVYDTKVDILDDNGDLLVSIL